MHTHIFKRTMTDENIVELKRALKDPLMFIDYPINFGKEDKDAIYTI